MSSRAGWSTNAGSAPRSSMTTGFSDVTTFWQTECDRGVSRALAQGS